MKILRIACAWLTSLALVACGGGGGSAGTSGFNTGTGTGTGTTPTPTTSEAVSVDLLASAVQLGSSGDAVTITAVVKGPGNVSLVNAPVSFGSDSGNLTSAATVTDRTGIATATLAAGSDKSNRTIKVTASSGAASGSIEIPVVANTSTASAAATAIDVLTSAVQLGTGGDQVTISAIVKGAGNVSLPAVPVSFSADSGILLSPATVTDATGLATATLSTGANKSNRNIKVTVLSGTISGSVVVPVAGTALAYAGVTTVRRGEAVTVGVKATDSRGAVIPGVAVVIRSSLGNSLSTASATTDAQGNVSIRYTATNSGTDTLTFEGAGTSAAATIQISAEDFTFVSPAANTQIPVGTTGQPVTVRYLLNGAPQANKTILFAATAGRVTPSSTVTNADGQATVTVAADTAGPAIVQATYIAPGVNAQATLPVEFVALVPAKLVLQVTPTALGPNPAGSTAQQAQVVATVTDSVGNPVRGKTVNFTRKSDPSAGNLNQASAVTDSSGQASVQYIAGALTTASNGVELTATVSDTLISGSTKLTVNQSALFIALGTGNTITNLDEQTYKKDWVVYVTDANGVSVPNVNLTIKVLPVGYCRGELVFSTADNVWAMSTSARYYDNEDLNFNGVLDGAPTEDSNGNGFLDPGNVISVTTATSTSAASSGTVKTDSTGRATVSLIYAESYAPWVKVRLRAEAVVTGTESSKETSFFVVGLAADFTSRSIPPAGVVSPFGGDPGSSTKSCLSQR